MSPRKTYEVPPNLEGVRLDKVLTEILPDSGLRFRRRLCDENSVLVDGYGRKPGYKVRSGQQLVIEEEAEAMSYKQLGLSVIKQTEMFAAVFKPGGVHSAVIVGKNGSSVEEALPEMFPGTTPILMNRLDYLTSGLLLVALNKDGEEAYLAMENEGEIKKFYLATIQGRLDGFVSIKSALDTDDRKKTRVYVENDTDVHRWTDVEVLSHDNDLNTTRVRCLIMKGARHQIRAHLSSIGHPIVGDPLYGDGVDGDTLQLQHQRIEFKGFSAEVNESF